MEKRDFVELFRHEICGLVMDAAVSRDQGASLAMRTRMTFTRIDTILAGIYDKLAPKPAPISNPKK